MNVTLVSGCFDLLHPGHLSFLRDARAFGDPVHIALGADATIHRLKDRAPVQTQAERHAVLAALRLVDFVHDSPPGDELDFVSVVNRLRVLGCVVRVVVNPDQDSPRKRDAVAALGCRYCVIPGVCRDTATRSSSALRRRMGCGFLPYRIDLAGGWLDQPAVNEFTSGSVVTLCIGGGPYAARSGLASSTHATAESLWGDSLPRNTPPVVAARLLWGAENPPDAASTSGSQDAIGITHQGITSSFYTTGHRWPGSIETLMAPDEAASWFGGKIWLYPFRRRLGSYNPFAHHCIGHRGARKLALAADTCVRSICRRDWALFRESVAACHDAQVALFPATVPDDIRDEVNSLRAEYPASKFCGAGGGGYMFIVSDTQGPGFVPVPIYNA